ncbi:MAG: TolC family protein, partial [Bacteroidia bacterium]
MSLLLLKYQMSMPLGSDLSLTEKISDYKVAAIPDASQKPNYSNRIEYSLLESQKKLQQLDLKNHRLAYLPRLSAFLNEGIFSQSPKFNYFTENTLWYGYGMYGLNMNIPIFDGLQNSYQSQQSKIKLQEVENNILSLEQTIELQIKTAEISFKNGLASLESQNKNMELAAEVAQVTKEKYKQGVGTSLEVTSAETSLLEAQTNYFSALYDALISKVDYDKANGNLK